jgi:hypothetical protein
MLRSVFEIEKRPASRYYAPMGGVLHLPYHFREQYGVMKVLTHLIFSPTPS